MNFRVVGEEVLYTTEKYPCLSGRDLDTLVEMAAKTGRGRIRLCTHEDGDSKLQEMVIVHGGDAYVRPHKHTDKDESLQVLRGRADMVFFNDDGSIDQVIPLGAPSGEHPFACRVPVEAYHMLVIRSEVLVFLEATTGPFDRDNMIFAAWSPEDNTPETAIYLDGIDEQIKERLK